MIRKHTLHILNGQAMFDYFKKTHFLEDEMMVPFNEAMCIGSISDDLFTQEFVEKRAMVHDVTTEKYTEITLKPLDPLFRKDFTHIEMWFEADMFCQINILTILAWLDQQGHKNPINLHIVGDMFEPMERYSLMAEGYDAIFKQVLIHKTMPQSIHPESLKRGIELYSAFLSKESNLMLYIKEHENLSEKELVYALIENFKEYGLGDIQYLKLIRNVRNS
jgi:hypothetical protein